MFDKKRGVFVIKRTEPLEAGMYMLVSHENAPAEFIVEKSQHFRIDMKYPEFGVDMKFTGSPENQLFVDFNNKIRPLHQEFSELRKQYDALEDKNSPKGKEISEKIQDILKRIEDVRTQFIEDNPKHLMAAVFRAQRDVEVPEAPDDIPENERTHWRYNYFKDNYFGNMDLSDDRLLRTPIFHQRLENYIDKVLSPLPDSLISGIDRLIEQIRNTPELFKYVVWFTTDKFMRSQIVGYDAIWVHLAEKYYLSGDAVWANEQVLENFQNAVNKTKPLLIGSVPAEFMCPDTTITADMTDFPWSSYRSVFSPKNRYTVVIFWEPGCGHCKKQMAALRDFYNEKRKELDFEVFAVCRDKNVDAWKKYIYENNMTHWINVNGKASTIRYDELWDVHSVPTIYVLDSKKRIVTKRIEAEQIEPVIRNWNALHYND
jgi:thiol-disulfide isomerase/thioredoxin